MNKDNTQEQSIKGYCPYCQKERDLKHEWRNWYRCQACLNKSQYEPQPDDNKTPKRDFFKENNNVEWNEQGEPLYTAKQVEDFIKAGKTLENSEKGTGELSREYLFKERERQDKIIKELENRNKELERLLESQFYERLMYTHSLQQVNGKWQQYKSQHPEAFKG